MSALSRRLQRRLPAPARRLATRLRRDDGDALLLTILLIVAVTGLSLVLLAVLTSQYLPLAANQKRTRASYAAESGLQAGLTLLRTSTHTTVSGAVYGDRGKLPCITGAKAGSIQGAVDGTGADTVSYEVDFQYLLSNPSGHTNAWISSNAMKCSDLAATQPTYAVLSATGTDATVAGTSGNGRRQMTAVYQFTTTTTNIVGGRIYATDSGQMCLRADSATVGSQLRFYASSSCSQDDLELWYYTPTWQIQLASTISTATETKTPLCITGSSGNATLQVCKSSTDPQRWNQLWDWSPGGQYDWSGMQAPVGGKIPQNPSSVFLHRGSGNRLTIESGVTNMSPDPAVGAGAASYATQQLVNYQQFGRCADVTDQQIGKSFMIVYPCKQDPSGNNNFAWNHKWAYQEPAKYYQKTDPAHDDESDYTCDKNHESQCRRGPQTITVSGYCLTTKDGAELVFQNCNGSTQQKFTRYTGITDPSTGKADRTDNWTIQDAKGRCLTADASVTYNGWSHLRMLPCDSSLVQKWNAPAQTTTASFGGFREGGDDD
jgi:Tfp pilus assembly protein PilX